MLFSGPIENFFKRPNEPALSDGDCVLYHLRVDLEKLYGAEDSFDLDPSSHAILATMGLLSGLDYLAQAYLGRPSTGDRFVQLLTDLAAMEYREFKRHCSTRPLVCNPITCGLDGLGKARLHHGEEILHTHLSIAPNRGKCGVLPWWRGL